MKLAIRAVSVILTSALILTSPGLPCYQALAGGTIENISTVLPSVGMVGANVNADSHIDVNGGLAPAAGLMPAAAAPANMDPEAIHDFIRETVAVNSTELVNFAEELSKRHIDSEIRSPDGAAPTIQIKPSADGKSYSVTVLQYLKRHLENGDVWDKTKSEVGQFEVSAGEHGRFELKSAKVLVGPGVWEFPYLESATKSSEEKFQDLVKSGKWDPEFLKKIAPENRVRKYEVTGDSPRLAAAEAQNAVPAARFAAPSPRVGVDPSSFAYHWMRTTSSLFDLLNRFVTWDKLPPFLGLINLRTIEFRMRLDNLKDSEKYASTGYKDLGNAGPSDPKTARTANGTSNDLASPTMGAANTRFGDQNIPGRPWKDFATANPNPRDISNTLLKRNKFIPAEIINILAGAWIQFMVHDWMNHVRAPITDNPIRIPVKEGDNWPAKEIIVDRTAPDPTRPANSDGPPTFLNSETQWWDLSMVYGSSWEKQKSLRTFNDGKLEIGADGRLPESTDLSGIDKTGFEQNYWVGLSVLHTLFVKEHNAIAEALKKTYPGMSDQELFDKARLINVALAAKIHTTEWTPAILPNATLQKVMHGDWYGVLGKPFKLRLLGWTKTHPKLAKFLLGGFVSEIFFGVPGTRTQHYEAPYAMTHAFNDVYRLHELVPDDYELVSLATQQVLDRLKFVDLHGNKTRDVTAKFSWADIVESLGKSSAGAVVLNNFPESLRQIHTTDGRLVDLAAMDILRSRERGELSYNDFRKMVGKPAVKSFEELTSGDKEKAKIISDLYGGDISKLDLMVGLRAEKFPKGFGFSDTAFRIFILMAPRRLKSDRFLSELYKPEVYTDLGIDWVEHNTLATMMTRHYPELKSVLEGWDNAFKPFPAPNTQNDRMMETMRQAARKQFTSGLVSAVFSATLAAAAYTLGSASVLGASVLGIFPAVAALASYWFGETPVGRMQQAADQAKTDSKAGLSTALFETEGEAARSARAARFGALASMDLGGMIGWHLFASSPILGAFLGGAAVIAGLRAWKASKAYQESNHLLRVGLFSSIKPALNQIPVDQIPGANALEKHGRFFSGGKEVSHFSDTYHWAKATGLSFFLAFTTALSWHLLFSSKSQKNMSAEDKARLKPGKFDNYIPGLLDTQGKSSTRVYASQDIPGVVKRGDVDMREFERIFTEFAVGRDYVTEQDLTRMQKANDDRDRANASWFQRFTGRIASKKRFNQAMLTIADRVVYEDGKLVPAISREQLLRLFQGAGQFDIVQARTGENFERMLTKSK